MSDLLKWYMNTDPTPSISADSNQQICKSLVTAMLVNAIEELRLYLTPAPKLKPSYYGYAKKPLSELRWFIASPDGGEALADGADLSSVFETYRRKAMPLLLQAEQIANSDKGSWLDVFPFYFEVVSENPRKRIHHSSPNNPYSSVDIISHQIELFTEYTTPALP